MPVDTELGDMDTDCLQVMIEDMAKGHTAFTEDQAANEEIMATVTSFAAGRKFDEVGSMEAAAAEVIMKKKP